MNDDCARISARTTHATSAPPSSLAMVSKPIAASRVTIT
jgi:hypothetical protein